MILTSFRSVVVCLLFSFFTFSFSAQAAEKEKASAPTAEREEKLKDLTEKVETEKARQRDLQNKVKLLEKDLHGLKKELISATSNVQKNQKKLGELEAKLAELQTQKSDMLAKLTADRGSLASLIVALERIRRLPPDTLIARPGAPLDTANAATILGAILPELEKRAKDLKNQLAALQLVEDDLNKNREDLSKTTEKLRDDQKEMDALLDSRQKTYSKTRQEEKSQAATVAAISKEAQNFRELIEKIDRQNREARRKKMKLPPRNKKEVTPDDDVDERALAASLPALGSAQPPISGIIKTRYGEKDEIGATCQGIKFESRGGAVVVAPMGGIVRYAGPFKTYGSIILLEHKNKYHSLIAGLGKIDTFVGQSVDAGEPIGRLSSSANGEKPRLYYELRFEGQPINPARKLADLGG